MAGALLGIAVGVRVRNGDVLELGLIERDRRRDRLFVERKHVRRRHPTDAGENDADADDKGKIDQAAEAAAAAGAARRFRLGRARGAHGGFCLYLRLRRWARGWLWARGRRLLRMGASRPLLPRLFGARRLRLGRAGLCMRLHGMGTRGALSLRAHRMRLCRTRGALSLRAHRMRLCRARGALPLRTYRTRLGRVRGVLSLRTYRARLGRMCGALPLRLCRTAAGRLRGCRTLRAGRILLVAEQLIKILKVIRHGSVSLSTWNSFLPPTRRRNPHAPRGIR